MSNVASHLAVDSDSDLSSAINSNLSPVADLPLSLSLSLYTVISTSSLTTNRDVERARPQRPLLVNMRSPSRSQLQTIYACKTRETTKIAIDTWSMNLQERSLGVKTVSGLGVQTAGSPEYITGTDALLA
ncbi:hypothetical protein EVAR_57575_1 [Eumeta japonica]|uniref:Uncharacterized protein n=1 Tax=Eumeta variegata TaxID=151549 RepID=A0A4C1Z857_EUMVA|nr:hypothetical protein EVAR_57575_1 [Eumeta japonica]